MANPIGEDGYPLENHHVARQDQFGQRNLILRCTHLAIHEGEIDAVRDAFERDGLRGNPNAWTAKQYDR